MIKMVAPKGLKEFSIAGRKFTVPPDGVVDIPDEAVVEMTAHGLKVHPPKQVNQQGQQK